MSDVMNGIKTTNLPREFAIDELIGNVTVEGVEQTSRIPFSALANQLAGTGSFIFGNMVYVQTKAQLDAITPSTETAGGAVLADPTATNNGYYTRSAGAWVKARGLPDTFARVVLDGTANAQTGVIQTGVNPADIKVFFAVVVTENTGPMTLSHNGEAPRDVVNLVGNALSAGEWTGVVMYFVNDDGDYQLLIDAGAAAAAAQSASEAAASLASFLSRYLGPYPDDASATAAAGGAPSVGQLYWNTTNGKLKAWDGASWVASDLALNDGDVTEQKLAAALALSTVKVVTSIAELKTVNTARYNAAYLLHARRGGMFRWDSASLVTSMAPTSLATSAVDDATDTITVTAHGLETGDAVSPQTSVNGLSNTIAYYVIRLGANTFKLATSWANALAGTALDFTGTSAITFRKILDTGYGIYVPRTTGRASGADGAWVRQWSGSINPEWFGAVGDNTTDCTEALRSMFGVISASGAGDYAAARVQFPSGRYRTSPITTNIAGCTITGVSRLATRFSARDAAQNHIFHFTNTSANITIQDFEITGWTTTLELANYPAYGIIFEGGTNELYNYRINRCRRGFWVKRGNYCKFKYAQIGFFDQWGIQLGHIDNSPNGAALSETRLEELAIYSSASSITGGASENIGVQMRLSTDNGATICTRCEGGSTVIGIENVDGLGLGDSRATGFISLVDYNSGKNSTAGFWNKNNGNNLRIVNSRFSAQDSASADGVRLDGPIMAALFTNVDCHWCARDGVRLLGGVSLTIEGGALYELGLSDGSVHGTGVDCASGSAKVSITGVIIDNSLQSSTSRIMDHGVYVSNNFTGTVDFYETAKARNAAIATIAKQVSGAATVRHLTMNTATL